MADSAAPGEDPAGKVKGKPKSRTARDMEALVTKTALKNGVDPATLDGAGREKLKAKMAAAGASPKSRRGGGKKAEKVDLFKDSVANRALRNTKGLEEWQQKSKQCKRHRKLVALERQRELEKVFAQREVHLIEVARVRAVHLERVRTQRRWLQILKVTVAAAKLKKALVEAGAQDAKAQAREAQARERAQTRTKVVMRDVEAEQQRRIATYGTAANDSQRARCREFSRAISSKFVDSADRRKKFSAAIILRFLSDFAAESRKFMVVMKRFRAKVVVCQRVVRKHVTVRFQRIQLLRQMFNKHATTNGRTIWLRAKESLMRQNLHVMTAEAKEALSSLDVRRIPDRFASGAVNAFYSAKHHEYAEATEIFMSGESAQAARSQFTALEMRRLLGSDISHHHELALLIYQKRRIKRPPFLFFSQLRANKVEILNALVRQCYDIMLTAHKTTTIHDMAMSSDKDTESDKEVRRWKF